MTSPISHLSQMDFTYLTKFDDNDFEEKNILDDLLEPISNEYDADIGDETLNKEYKAFTFNLGGIDIDHDEAANLCDTNYFGSDLNAKVVNSIEKYLEYYPAKYLSGYFNTGISGKLLIGPDDWGFNKGIPFLEDPDIPALTTKFYQLLESKILNKRFDGNIRDFVNIKFIKMTYDQETLRTYANKRHPAYIKYLEERIKYKELVRAQREEYNIWKARYTSIQRKLVDLINGFHDTRILIINYAKKLSPGNPVIKLLESDSIIESLSPDQIALVVSDRTNPYHWASEWKEYMCEVFRNERPDVSKIIFPDFNTPFNLINSVSNMIPYWIANNPNLNLYTIQIDYSYDPVQMNRLGKWMYLDKNNKYVSCTRVIKSDGEPANFPD